MTICDGYSIQQYPNQNKIEITLPQTMVTMTTTVSPVENRKIVLTEKEEAILLMMVIQFMRGAGWQNVKIARITSISDV